MVEEGDYFLALKVTVIVNICGIVVAVGALFVVEYLFYDG